MVLLRQVNSPVLNGGYPSRMREFWRQNREKIRLQLHYSVLFGVPCLAIFVMALSPPGDLPVAAWRAALLIAWMAIWWMTEAVPLAVTALVPLVIFPLSGIRAIEETAASYAHPLIFLFLGGFMLARAMERWGLHRRLALKVLAFGGSRPDRVIASLMVVTAFLSLWVSNTATAMVMLPIGRSVVLAYRDEINFSAALMLGIGYAATIGGIGSLIGTPPNALFAGFMENSYGIEIGFAQWMLVGMPVVFVLLPATWWLLTRFIFTLPDDRLIEFNQLRADSANLGPMSAGEKRVAILMITVALLWLFRPLLSELHPGILLSDPSIAIAGAILLFVVPADLRNREFLLRWKDVAAIRWDVIILFGGGLALASGIGSSGLAERIGNASLAWNHLSPFLLLAAATIIIVYLGELASNTAMAAVFLPIAGAVAIGMDISPLALALPITLAASLGFMLPVATPPNAIIFGSGAVTAKQMLHAGAILDVVGIGVVLVIGTTLGSVVFP